MIAAVFAGLIALVVALVVVSRMTGNRKKEAVASLEAEMEAVGQHSILDLVEEEIEDLNLRLISGADDLPPDVLLKVWSDSPAAVRSADRSALRYEVRDGVVPSEATPDDVELGVGSSPDPTPTIEDDAVETAESDTA